MLRSPAAEGKFKMTIEKKQNGTAYTFNLAGRLDTVTAPQLEAALGECLGDATAMTLDFKNIEYISSAGLRTLLKAQKQLGERAKVSIRNASDAVKEVFEITGFTEFLTIE